MTRENIKILIGDDSALTRKQMQDLLSELGCKFLILGANGEEAVSLYKQHSPDLVFMDIVMPVCDGIEAMKQIIDFDPNADIVVVSTIGTQDKLREAIEAGAKDFIQKPVRLETLNHILNSRTERK